MEANRIQYLSTIKEDVYSRLSLVSQQITQVNYNTGIFWIGITLLISIIGGTELFPSLINYLLIGSAIFGIFWVSMNLISFRINVGKQKGSVTANMSSELDKISSDPILIPLLGPISQSLQIVFIIASLPTLIITISQFLLNGIKPGLLFYILLAIYVLSYYILKKMAYSGSKKSVFPKETYNEMVEFFMPFLPIAFFDFIYVFYKMITSYQPLFTDINFPISIIFTFSFFIAIANYIYYINARHRLFEYQSRLLIIYNQLLKISDVNVDAVYNEITEAYQKLGSTTLFYRNILSMDIYIVVT